MSDATHVKGYFTWDAPQGANENTVYILLFVAARNEPSYVTQVVGATNTDALLLWETDYHCEIFIQLTFTANPRYSRHAALDFRTPNEFE